MRMPVTEIAVTGPRSGPPWEEALVVARVLRGAGHETYLVGGCVRDLLLGRSVHDIDLATAAPPDSVEQLFPRTIAVGKAFGVMIVVAPSGAHVEVATFRSDDAYIDGRRPTGVRSASVAEDVQRRDFTINALLYDPLGERVIDHVGGLEDLRTRTLRAVGDAAARLREDRLRVLRALRFAAQLDLTIAPETWAAIQTTELGGLSRERIMQEWLKALAGAHPERWLRLQLDSGRLRDWCVPLMTAEHAVLGARLSRLLAGEARLVAVAVWLSPAIPAEVDAWLEAQPLDKDLIAGVRWLRAHGDAVPLRALPVPARRRVLQHPLAPALARYLLCLYGSDDDLAAEFFAWLTAERALPAWQPLVRAADLLALGVRPGPTFGALLKRLEDAQLDGRFATMNDGMNLARAWIAAASAPGQRAD